LLVSVNPRATFKITKPNLPNHAKARDVLLPVKRHPKTYLYEDFALLTFVESFFCFLSFALPYAATSQPSCPLH